ncbi:MAG TPA: oligosaccharide flippase family protein [Alphaproteobacteria bacterium]|nr:oligosaccharide flippase family protein [Alphaproteobacteria bacterium]
MKTRTLTGTTHASLAIIASRMVNLAGKFALSFFIARYLGLAELGLYGLVLGIVTVFPAIAGFGLSSLLAREAVTQKPAQFTAVMAQLLKAQSLLYAALLPLALLIGWLTGQPHLAILTLALAYAEQLNNAIFDFLIARHQPLLANVLTTLRGGLWAFAFMLLAFLHPQAATLDTVLWIWLAGVTLAIIAFTAKAKSWPWAQALGQKFSLKTYIEHIRRAGWLYVGSIATLLGQNIDRYIVTLFLGLEATGVYVLFWSIGNALYNLTVSGVLQLARPHLIQARQKAKHYAVVYRQTAGRTLVSVLATQLPVALVFPLALPWLQRPLVEFYLPALWLVQVGMALRTGLEFFATGYYAHQRDAHIAQLNLLLLGLTVACNFALLPFLGLYGAAAAIGIAALFCLPYLKVRA